MNIKDIKSLGKIINQNHGNDPLFILFDNLLEYNPDLSHKQARDYFIELLRYMLDNKMIKLAGVYTIKENIWEGSTDEILDKFRKWYPSESEWDFQSDASIKFYFFDYCFIRWLKPYPIEIKV